MKRIGLVLVLLTLLMMPMATSVNAMASDAPGGGAGGDAKFAWIETLKTDTTYYNPGNTVSVAVTVRRGDDVLAVVYDAVLKLTVKKDDSTIFEMSENVSIPSPGGSHPMIFTVLLSEDAPLGTYSVGAELWSWGTELGDVREVSFEVVSISVAFSADKNAYAQGEPVTFTITNTGTITIHTYNTEVIPWWVERFDEDSREWVYVYPEFWILIVPEAVPIEPGGSVSWDWNQADGDSPGTYRAGVHWCVNERGYTSYTQEFEILPPSIIATPTPIPTPSATIRSPTPYSTITIGEEITIDLDCPTLIFEGPYQTSVCEVPADRYTGRLSLNDGEVWYTWVLNPGYYKLIEYDLATEEVFFEVGWILLVEPVPTPTPTPTVTPIPTPIYGPTERELPHNWTLKSVSFATPSELDTIEMNVKARPIYGESIFINVWEYPTVAYTAYVSVTEFSNSTDAGIAMQTITDVEEYYDFVYEFGDEGIRTHDSIYFRKDKFVVFVRDDRYIVTLAKIIDEKLEKFIIEPIPKGDFSITIDPKHARVSSRVGGSVNYTIAISAWDGFDSPIEASLMVTGSGFNETYALPTQYPPYPKTYTYTVDIPSGTLPGTYTGAITATGDGRTHTDSTMLEVPGFEAVFAIVGLLAIAYLLGRRKG